MLSTTMNTPGIPFPAYKGMEPYVFISYAHKDSAQVYPIISKFNQQGYAVWYDEGIEPGIEWPEEIANALNQSSLFVVFITPNSVNSENVRNEINFALARKMPFIAIHLSPTNLTPGLQLQIGSKQAILRYQLDEDSFTRKYQYSFNTVLHPEQKTALPQPPSVEVNVKNFRQTTQPQQSTPLQINKPAPGAIPFKCDVIRKAACTVIGLPEDRQLEQKHLMAISEINIFGNSYGAENLAVNKSANSLMIYQRNGPPVYLHERGSITELTDFAHFAKLIHLNIPFQQFSDLAPLGGLPLKTLDLSLNRLDDLTPLGGLKQLTNLTMDYCSYQDLKPIESLSGLALLSMIGIPYCSFQQLCTLKLDKLTNLKIANSQLESLQGISNFQALDFLEIQFCTIFEFEDLVNLQNLKFLLMTGTKCFDFSFLKKMPNLKSISVDEDQKPAIIELFGEKPAFLK